MVLNEPEKLFLGKLYLMYGDNISYAEDKDIWDKMYYRNPIVRGWDKFQWDGYLMVDLMTNKYKLTEKAIEELTNGTGT